MNAIHVIAPKAHHIVPASRYLLQSLGVRVSSLDGEILIVLLFALAAFAGYKIIAKTLSR